MKSRIWMLLLLLSCNEEQESVEVGKEVLLMEHSNSNTQEISYPHKTRIKLFDLSSSQSLYYQVICVDSYWGNVSGSSGKGDTMGAGVSQ